MKVDKTTAPKREIMTEVYSRISGYFRPVNQWNKAKQQEFTERKFATKEYINQAVKEI